MAARLFEFRFTPAYRLAALPFGITPARSEVRLDADSVQFRFGPWRVRTTRANIADAAITGPYTFVKTAGPAHLSLADKGLTFASNGDAGVCVSFHAPVGGIEPTGVLRHPSLTVTVDDCAALVDALSRTT